MARTRKSFKDQALELLQIFEMSIEHIGFPQSELDWINKFYDRKCTDEESAIKNRIVMVHIEFFGGMNFKDRNDQRNKILASQLSEEISEIKQLLEKLR
ncbi:hypothetical protein [Paenibacillus methanolicus]|uniref:hypothetical protein n=1 Tax=Paenibacillus methanolicus TaxID=582686 RepID=UPI0011E8053F|nr:hypothetical protein [Paenibacillus methanolicus]